MLIKQFKTSYFPWVILTLKAIYQPFALLIIGLLAYYSSLLLFAKLGISIYQIIITELIWLMILGSVIWLTFSLSNVINKQLLHIARAKGHRIIAVIIPVINNTIKIIVGLLVLNIGLSHVEFINHYVSILNKLLNLILIIAITWLLIQIINKLENYIASHYLDKLSGDFRARRVYTQTHVFKQLAVSLVILLAVATSLLIFDQARQIGASLLASATVIAAVATFSAQRTLATLFAGLQIAITQPIRIDDAVVVENESGTIEEIKLTYVVVRLWDLRRLILPINYFIEKPFQNWTRESADIMGPLFLYFDYRLPIQKVRNEFMQIVQQSKWWDRRVANLQVSDTKQNTIELRIVVSAENSSKLWDLRCEIRERLIDFINKTYPDCLPRVRSEVSLNLDKEKLEKGGSSN